MWNFVAQPGLATTVVDFTNDFSALAFGLFGLLALSAGLIVANTIRQHVPQKTEPVAGAVSAPADHRTAA